MLDKYDAYISKLNGFVTEEYFHKNGDYYEWAYADYGEYATLLNAECRISSMRLPSAGIPSTTA